MHHWTIPLVLFVLLFGCGILAFAALYCVRWDDYFAANAGRHIPQTTPTHTHTRIELARTALLMHAEVKWINWSCTNTHKHNQIDRKLKQTFNSNWRKNFVFIFSSIKPKEQHNVIRMKENRMQCDGGRRMLRTQTRCEFGLNYRKKKRKRRGREWWRRWQNTK